MRAVFPHVMRCDGLNIACQVVPDAPAAQVANWRPATAAGAGALPPAEQEQWTWSEAPRCPICSKEVGRVVGWAAVAVLAVGLAWTKLLW